MTHDEPGCDDLESEPVRSQGPESALESTNPEDPARRLSATGEFSETVAGASEVQGRTSAMLWARDLLFSLLASLFIITFVYQPVKVEGTSMLPRLGNQDRLFINKFAYHFEKIERGDVVVFHYPRDPSKSYIKRVIALPGDHLLIENGRVYLNSRLLQEPYVPKKYRDHWSQAEIVIPPGEFFVMGDHRSISSDSRDWGAVPRKDIYGKASFVYWPAADAGLVH